MSRRRIARLFRIRLGMVLLACGGAVGFAEARAATRSTGLATDLAVAGPGWFVVRDPVSAQLFATRRGDFRFDQSGYLVTTQAWRVQGFADAALSQHGDVRLDQTNEPPNADPQAIIVSFALDSTGRLQVILSDGTSFISGQVLLQSFLEPTKLHRAAYQLYADFEAAGPLAQLASPGTLGLGLIQSGELDVDPEPVRLFAWPAAKQAGALAEGILTQTGRPTDVGILGEGFFIARDPATHEPFATRAGLFLRDGDGFLVTYQRRRVQGYTDGALTALGDVRIDGNQRPPTSDPNAVLLSFRIDWDGRALVLLSDGTEFVRGQILLRHFRQPDLLKRASLGLLTGVDAAQPGEWLGSGRAYLSGLRQGALELIQVPEELLSLRQTLSDFPQGPLTHTGIGSDLALSGAGFFVVKPPTNASWLVTRAGHFCLDQDGYLVTSHGLRIQGFNDAELTTRGDLQMNGEGRPPSADPAAAVASYDVDASGRIQVRLADGTEFTRGQVLLQSFREAFALTPVGEGLYGNIAGAGPLPFAVEPGTSGLGRVISGALEITPEPETLTLPPHSGFRIVVSGEPGARWTLQATTDFRLWTTIAALTNAPEQTEFSAAPSALAQRYFRVLVE